MTTFAKLARTTRTNAHRYATRRACELAIGRVKAEYRKAGSYGNVHHELVEAVAECQYRWLELKPQS